MKQLVGDLVNEHRELHAWRKIIAKENPSAERHPVR